MSQAWVATTCEADLIAADAEARLDQIPGPDRPLRRLEEAFDREWDVVDGQLGWHSDAQGRLYGSERRGPAIVRLVEDPIGRLERGDVAALAGNGGGASLRGQ